MKGTRDHSYGERNCAQIGAFLKLISQGKWPQSNEKDHAKPSKRQIPTLASNKVSDAPESNKDQAIKTNCSKEEDPREDINSHLTRKSTGIHLPCIRQTILELLFAFAGYIAAEAEEICEIAN